MLWVQLNRDVIFSYGNRLRDELFFRFFLVLGVEDRIFKLRKRVLTSVWFLPIYMRGWNLSSFFYAVMMILSVIITFNFYDDFLLSCCLVSRMGRLTFDFELIGDITVVETSCLSSPSRDCDSLSSVILHVL